MRVAITQIYIRAGVNFPFTYLMQQWVSDELSQAADQADAFTQMYGTDVSLIINVSAKRGISSNEVRGPSVYKEDKTVEYSVFLPFDEVPDGSDRLRTAMRYLLDGVRTVFGKLDIATDRLDARIDAIVEHVCSHPEMLDNANLPGRN